MTGAKTELDAVIQVGAVGVPLAQVLDRGGHNLPATPPDYAGDVTNDGQNLVTVTAQDSPFWSNSTGIGDDATLEMAIRDNFRLWLLWRFPDSGGQGTTIYPLASIDWDVFFRGEGSVRAADYGTPAFFHPTAAAVITTHPYVVNHVPPGKLAPPDFNDHLKFL